MKKKKKEKKERKVKKKKKQENTRTKCFVQNEMQTIYYQG